MANTVTLPAETFDQYVTLLEELKEQVTALNEKVSALAQAIERDPEQAYFWTPQWQAAEAEADEDLRAGRYEDFDNVEDFIATLKKPVADPA